MRTNTELYRALEMDRPVLLTPQQVANTGLLSLYAVRKGIADGSIPFIKIGKHYRINYTRLLQQINSENT